MNNPVIIKKWHLILTLFGFVIALFTQVITITIFANDIKNLAEHNHEQIMAHVEDKSVHMPLTEKIKMFPMRTEFNDIKKGIAEIKKDVKQLLKQQ